MEEMNIRRAIWKIFYSGQSIAAAIAPFVERIEYSDELHGKSDELTLTLSDEAGVVLGATYSAAARRSEPDLAATSRRCKTAHRAQGSAPDIKGWAEPFLGMDGVFLRRLRRPKAEVVNGLACDIANLFRILQRHYPQFTDALQWQLTTRADFDRLIETNPDSLTDLERAARFLYLQRTTFGGKISSRDFAVRRTAPARFDIYSQTDK